MWLKLKTPLKAALLVAFVALCVWAIFPVQQKIKLGLDLRGGVRVLLELQPTKDVPRIDSQVQSQVEQVIQNRINGLGVTEPQISRVGDTRLLVELPDVKNPDEAVREPERRREPRVQDRPAAGRIARRGGAEERAG